MKKIVYVFVIVAALAMVSCGNKTKKAAAETTVIEEVATECTGDCASCPNAEAEAAAETPAAE